MVSKLRTHKRFSFSVRMKRSATPFPSGSRTKLGEPVDAEERDLLLKIVGQVVRPVVVPQPQPAGGAGADPAEAFADTLAEGLQGLEAGPALGGMQTDALGRAVVNGHEDTGRPLGDGHRGRHVGAPHHVRRLGGDRAVVRRRAMRLAHAVRGLEVVRTHSSAHPLLRGPNPLDPQLRPGFPVALTMKRRRLKHPADVAHQDLVRGRTDGPAAMPARAVPRCLPPRIDTRPRPCPHAADALHTIRPTGGDRLGAAPRVDLRRANGRPASSWSPFAYSNSVSIRSSPILACSRRWSSSPASVARLFKPAWPVAKNLSRPCEARAAVMPNSRDTDSRSSPRRRRSTVARVLPPSTVATPPLSRSNQTA